jgi:hypothetical protein
MNNNQYEDFSQQEFNIEPFIEAYLQVFQQDTKKLN